MLLILETPQLLFLTLVSPEKAHSGSCFCVSLASKGVAVLYAWQSWSEKLCPCFNYKWGSESEYNTFSVSQMEDRLGLLKAENFLNIYIVIDKHWLKIKKKKNPPFILRKQGCPSIWNISWCHYYKQLSSKWPIYLIQKNSSYTLMHVE